jgi:hypothetical protein
VTTPRIPKPGEVQHLSAGVEWRVPDDIALPEWIDRNDRNDFVSWLREIGSANGGYAEWRTARELSLEVRGQNDVAEPWLRAALRELDRGEIGRLCHDGARVMPGQAHPACWFAAYRMGLDFDALVAATDLQNLRVVIARAIEDLNKRPKRRAGRRDMNGRDRLLSATIQKLRSYVIAWPNGTVKRASLAVARTAADDILIACGVPSASNERNAKSIARAARRIK